MSPWLKALLCVLTSTLIGAVFGLVSRVLGLDRPGSLVVVAIVAFISSGALTYWTGRKATR